MSLNFPVTGRAKKWWMTLLSFAVLSAAFGWLAYQLTAKQVTVILDGKKQQLTAHAATVGDLLEDLNVGVSPHDFVKPGVDAKLSDELTIKWEPAIQVTFDRNGKSETAWTTADTVAGMLASMQIDVGDHDQLTPSLDTPISEGMTISYDSGFQVKLNIGGKNKTIWTTAKDSTTVADFLKKMGINYDNNDEIKPELDTLLTAAEEINVTYIKKVTDVVEQPIDFAVITKKDDSLAKGEERVIQSGEEGKIEKTYEITLRNGKEVKRELVSKKKVKDSRDRIVAVGTRVNRQPSRGGGSDSTPTVNGDVKQFYMSSTAYTASCNGCSGITSTGINLKANPDAKVIAVDPNLIPLGSRVWVQGYGYAIAADTGGAIHGHHIDVFFPTKSSAYRWGRRTVLVKVLD
ncbi:MAG TPA: ubiquitin-like domain-containing protein [Bacillales bacterium]|nr:ubiquitin-like domain-containing protein [Bacillales bacterium]